MPVMAPVSLSKSQSPYSGLQSPLYDLIRDLLGSLQSAVPTQVSFLAALFHSNPRVLQALALAVPSTWVVLLAKVTSNFKKDLKRNKGILVNHDSLKCIQWLYAPAENEIGVMYTPGDSLT